MMSMGPKVGACRQTRLESVSTVADSSCGHSPDLDPRDRFGTRGTFFSSMESEMDTNFTLPGHEVPCDDVMGNATLAANPVAWLPSPAHKSSRREGYRASGEHRMDVTTMDVATVVSPMETTEAEPCSPRTPRNAPVRRNATSPPPLVPQSKMTKPAMLRALSANSLDQVREVLKLDPAAAVEPFWEHSVEPPLCCAVRLKCSASIVELLLKHGASREAQDTRYRTPATILSQHQKTKPDWGSNPPMWVSPAVPRMMMPEGCPDQWHQEISNLLASRSGA